MERRNKGLNVQLKIVHWQKRIERDRHLQKNWSKCSPIIENKLQFLVQVLGLEKVTLILFIKKEHSGTCIPMFQPTTALTARLFTSGFRRCWRRRSFCCTGSPAAQWSRDCHPSQSGFLLHHTKSWQVREPQKSSFF